MLRKKEFVALVEDIAAPFISEIHEQRIDFEIIPENSLPKALCMESKIFSLILFNLIQNAVKYNKFGGLICIILESNSNHTRLVVSVKDTGIGMNKDQQKNLFKTF